MAHDSSRPSWTCAEVGSLPEPPALGSASEQILYRRVPGVAHAELLTVRRSPRLWRTCDDGYTFRVVPEAWNEPRASFECFYRRQSRRVVPGGLEVLEPGEVHRVDRVSGHGSFWSLRVSLDGIARIAEGLGLPPRPHLLLDHLHEPALDACFARLRRALDEGGASQIESGLAECVSAVLRRCADPRPQGRPLGPRGSLRRVHDFLRSQYARPVAIGELEVLSGMSRFHLIRSFTRAYGLPPHAYQLHVRTLRARDLLRAGVPPSDIRVGFADQSHLTRHFKKVFGVTPGEYARHIGPRHARRS
jgi:AraC-like DNA-binding protein